MNFGNSPAVRPHLSPESDLFAQSLDPGLKFHSEAALCVVAGFWVSLGRGFSAALLRRLQLRVQPPGFPAVVQRPQAGESPFPKSLCASAWLPGDQQWNVWMPCCPCGYEVIKVNKPCREEQAEPTLGGAVRGVRP